jgi:hypothetical protein
VSRRRSGVHKPSPGNLKCIRAANYDPFLHGGENEVGAGTEGDERGRLLVELSKVHLKERSRDQICHKWRVQAHARTST